MDRAPLRVIHDTYPGYSAVAVDNNSNEVYLQDENLFGLKVFNRLDNTPSTARLTEPKRVVGGLLTKLEFNCGLYVDPKTGDVYSVANDTIDTTVIFPHGASGNVKPGRELATPHGSYGIAVDEEKQELFLTVEHENSVVVYRKNASGKDKPIRTLSGNHTGLEDPHGIALDTKDKWLFVVNHGNVAYRAEPGAAGDPAPGGARVFARGSGKFEPPSITVYPLDASGDTAPLRTIEGPATQLNWPAAMYMDGERGELYVANDMDDSILVFRATDTGNVPPSRFIKGPKTGLKNPTGVFVDTQNKEIWASNMGNHAATVYSLAASGDVAPLRMIRSAPAGKVSLSIGNPGAVTYDTKREQILVPN
jgi:DNA-binding beta-propeller fold protein YncE